ncbi:hypothetical protein, partial [Plebeiibacterium sediminum]
MEVTYCADEAANFEITSLNDDVMVSGNIERYTFDWNISALNIPEDGGLQTTNEFDVVVTRITTGCTSEAHLTIYVNPDPEVKDVEAIYCTDEVADFDIASFNERVLASGNSEDYNFNWNAS